jgi:hypothetical protein
MLRTIFRQLTKVTWCLCGLSNLFYVTLRVCRDKLLCILVLYVLLEPKGLEKSTDWAISSDRCYIRGACFEITPANSAAVRFLPVSALTASCARRVVRSQIKGVTVQGR